MVAGDDRGFSAGARAFRGGRDRRRRAAGGTYDRGEGDRGVHRLGRTALRVARERPESPVIGLTPQLETARRMAVVWGVHAVVVPDVHSLGEAVTRAGTLLGARASPAWGRNRGDRRASVPAAGSGQRTRFGW